MINRFVNEHEPFFDVDEDKFSDWKTLRGTSWRGRDCDDTKKYVYPGRKNTNENDEVDSNCNGIFGKALNGTSYESLLCSGTPYYGTAILGYYLFIYLFYFILFYFKYYYYFFYLIIYYFYLF